VRVVLSNEYGSQPLVIGAAHIALSDSGAAIKAGSDRALTFNESFTIPLGALAISDPVELSVAPLSSVAVSLFLPGVTTTTTMHWDARQTALYRGGEQGRRRRHPARFQNRISAVPEWNPGRCAGGRACDRDLRRLDHGWGRLHPRTPTTAGQICLPSGFKRRMAPRSPSSTKEYPALGCLPIAWA
jgi:hypothetical protein